MNKSVNPFLSCDKEFLHQFLHIANTNMYLFDIKTISLAICALLDISYSKAQEPRHNKKP